MSVLDHIVLDEARYDLQDTDGRAMLAPTEASTTASAAHATGSYFIYNGTLYQATADIAQGGTIITSGSGQNCKAVTVGGELAGAKSDLSGMNTASASDTGKALKAKTIANGKVTEWEFGTAGGEPGPPGDDGVTFTPAVSSAGVISWTNDGGRQNPESVDLVAAVLAAQPAAEGVSF